MAKKGIFNNPIAPKKWETGPLSSSDISRDEMDARGLFDVGCNYGSGFRNPVGKERATAESPIPKGVKKQNPRTLA